MPLLGSVYPTYSSVTLKEYKKTDNLLIKKEIIDFILSDYGLELLEWQYLLLLNLFKKDKEGKVRFSNVSYSIPRRNGKSLTILAYAIIWAVMGERVVYTSYSDDSAVQFYEELHNFIMESPRANDWKLSPLTLQRSRKATNKKSKGYVRVFTRASKNRGSGADKIIYDESNDLKESEIGSLSPLVANNTRTGQQIFLGTPSIPEKLDGKHYSLDNDFFQIIAENNKQADKGLHLEWATDKIAKTKDNEKEIARCNPSYNQKLSNGNILLDYNSFQDPCTMMQFSVERLGYNFENIKNNQVLKVKHYNDNLLTYQEIDDLADKRPFYSIGIKCSPDLSLAYIVRTVRMDALNYFIDVLEVVDLVENDEWDVYFANIIAMYNSQPKCKNVVIDGVFVATLKSSLINYGLWNAQKNLHSFGKITFVRPSEVGEACKIFTQYFSIGRCYFYKSDNDWLKKRVEGQKKRYISKDAHGFVNETNASGVLFEAFSNSLLFLSRS